MNQVISNYAQAFFDIAKKNNAVSSYKKELDDVFSILNSIDNSKEFFISVGISKNEKKELLDNSFRGKINNNTLNFLKLLIDKNRFNILNQIVHEFHRLCNVDLNIKEGIIEVPRILNDEDIKRLEESLSDNNRVVLIQKVNKSLISGFKIVFDDEVIDNSMKEKIRRLNSKLMKGDNSWN